MIAIGTFTPTLQALSVDVIPADKLAQLKPIIAAWPRTREDLLGLDRSLGGPAFFNIHCKNKGIYHIDDRDIFRPLYYFEMYFASSASDPEQVAWMARGTVQVGGFKLESLVKRIAGVDRLPLGAALAEPLAKRKIPREVWGWIQRFTRIYNASKHEMNQPMDTHLFTYQDVLLSYFIVRHLAARLYPFAKLNTDLAIFDRECEESHGV